MHCQQTAEEEEEEGRLFFSCTHRAFWLAAVDNSSNPIGRPRRHSWICYHRFPRHSTCTRRTSRHVTAWRLSGVCLKLIKLEMEFFTSLCTFTSEPPAGIGIFFVFLPSSSSSSKTTSPTSRHAEPEEYLFFFNHKRCESFFSCSLSADRLFMHRQVRQAPEWELDAAALHISLKKKNQIMRLFVCVFNEEENKTTSELIIKIILNVVSSCSDVHRWISPTVACVFIISCGFSRVSYIVLEAWPHSHYFRRMRRWRTFADVRLLINPTRA